MSYQPNSPARLDRPRGGFLAVLCAPHKKHTDTGAVWYRRGLGAPALGACEQETRLSQRFKGQESLILGVLPVKKRPTI